MATHGELAKSNHKALSYAQQDTLWKPTEGASNESSAVSS